MKVNNLYNNSNLKKIGEGGPFSIFEWQQDMSITPGNAVEAYFMKEMNYKKRQVLCKVNGDALRFQAGAMQWIAGNIEMSSGIKGAGNLFGKMVKSAVTNESVAKPIYSGNGYIMLEPTFNYLLIEDVGSWGQGIVLDDGLFYACEDRINERVVPRNNMSSAILGGEGFFNLTLSGEGYCVLESPVPREELIEFVLDNDCLKVDGNMAIAWSSSLQFSVEKSTKSLLGSAISGEGFVNVFRGSGRVLLAPTMPGSVDHSSHGPETRVSSKGVLGSVINAVTD